MVYRLFSNFWAGKEKDYFIENLGVLLAAGMNILSALEAVKAEMRSEKMRTIIDDLKEEIDAGSPMWRALDKINLLPKNIISLVRVGEETGRLSDNLRVIAVQQQKERFFRSKIRSAMMYPILVLSLTLIIGVGIAWFILPRLASVFSQLRMDLPFFTKILIGLGNFLNVYGITAVPAFLVSVAAVIYLIFFYSRTKFVGHALLFSLPAVKGLMRDIELARFGYIFGMLLEAGLPVLDALDSLLEATTFYAYKNFYAHLRDSIEEGNSFQKSFALNPNTNKLIPIHIQQMIVAGEQSGRLSATFLKIGEIFESKTETTTKNLAVILEPILLVIVWVGVVSVALAVILPIYSLIGGLNP